jgi:hypothetical protein|tara:strand:- start:157 stop:471 length:315 start_codon:yes stop_codon:yes gene_type:complete
VKRIIIVVIFLFLSLNLSAQKFKMGGDKMLHFTASYTISHITYHYLQPRVGYKKAKIYSTIISLGTGIIKEIIDERYRGGWEQGDIYANMGGIILFRIDIPLHQ